MFIESFILICLVFTNSAEQQANERDKTINIAIETALEFNKEDKEADLMFLNNVQRLIGKVKTVLKEHDSLRRNVNGGHIEKFSDVILNLVETLNKFNDTDLKYFFNILCDEVSKYHYKDGKLYYDITNNASSRSFVVRELNKIRNLPASDIRDKIINLSKKIKQETFTKEEKDLVDSMNSLYTNDFKNKFKKVNLDLIKFEKGGLGEKGLMNVIKEGVRFVFVDHITQLNYNASVALKADLKKYWTVLAELAKKVKDADLEFRKHNVVTTDKYINEKTTLKTSTQSKEQVVTKKILRYATEDEHLLPIERSTKKIKIKPSNFYKEAKFIKDIDETAKLELINKDITKKTTEDKGYTYKQMYVEKNIDLKYDPDAYNKLTTEHIELKLDNDTATEEAKRTTKIKKRPKDNLRTKKRINKNKDFTLRQVILESEDRAYDFDNDISSDEFDAAMTTNKDIARAVSIENVTTNLPLETIHSITTKFIEGTPTMNQINNVNGGVMSIIPKLHLTENIPEPKINLKFRQHDSSEELPVFRQKNVQNDYSIEVATANNNQRGAKKVIKLPKDKILVNRNLLERIKHIEEELNVVRSQVERDKLIIRDLKSKVL